MNILANVFKKVTIVLILLSLNLDANAQEKGNFAVGGRIVLIGAGAKFQYNVTDPIRLEASITRVTAIIIDAIDFSVNGHYLFPVSNKINLYPFVGFSIGDFSVLGMDAGTEFCFDFGGGIDIKLGSNRILNFDIKYPAAYLAFSAGLAWMF